jgi:tetratricopeptide (TPR) repeat protein
MNPTNASGKYDVEIAVRREDTVSVRSMQQFREGLEQLSLGEPDAAVVALKGALEHAPNLPDVHVALGVAYAMTSRIYPAIDHLTHASELEPDNFHAQFKLAQLYFLLRVPAKGYETARRALACAGTLDERRLIAQLLRQERQRERDGIARPWFYKAFRRPVLWLGATGTAAMLFALLLHMS